MIVVLTVVPAGCPPGANASEHGLTLVQPPEDARAGVGAASIAIPSMAVAATAKSAPVVVRTALRMAATPVRVNRLPGGDAFGQHALPVWTVLVRVRLVIRPFLRLNARSTCERVQGAGSKGSLISGSKRSAAPKGPQPWPPRPEVPATAPLATADHRIQKILAQQPRQHGR